MEETKNEVSEAMVRVDERTNRLKETKDAMKRYADQSKNMANTAELLKQKYSKKSPSSWF